MYFYLKLMFQSFFFPPGINVVMAVAGLLLLRRHRRIAWTLIITALAVLYLFSLPITAVALMSGLQPYPALTAQDIRNHPTQAIVILGGGLNRMAPEYGGATINKLALERLRYGAHLHHQTGLPIVVSGGVVLEGQAEALLMKSALEQDFRVPVAWTEDQSRTTWENATNTTALLRSNNIQHVYLVTHAWHMPRAVLSFEKAGLDVIPAPTGFIGKGGWQTAQLWLPNARALENNDFALHEILGLIWYRLKS
jgi:uncharacterized SAM-binding protein YcdF (DUF218 family)